ncbi:peptidoglycan-binding protein [Streptomyces scabiei]|uniref:peptidoglycan-binding protein n=1 Tax=Streptomyces scabiei TaxID=1930 RepID=UPI000A3841D4|nr:peptidoglycan-binding protein [Streptomyces scabiei]
MRTLRWGDSGDDVAALQQSLQALRYYGGAVDGRFTALTRSAVVAFQRARGLIADGAAGPATLAALGLGLGLGEPASPVPQFPPPQDGAQQPPPAGARALSLHIGLNSVDKSAYGGWSGRLSGGEQDAHTMTRIARAEGFTTRRLLSGDATVPNVLDAITDAARRLGPGDFFLLTYAGHGGQIAGTDGEDETDLENETWVLYDRMLVDDELSAAFAEFREGVNLVLVSDSCHSGTLYRRGLEVSGVEETEYAAVKRAFYQNLGVTRDPLSAAGIVQHLVADLRDEQHDEQRTMARVVTREIPLDANAEVVLADRRFYRDIQNRARSRSSIMASGVALSACQDNQLSQEVNGAGVFTTALHRTWADNGFTGSYDVFHRAIVAQMGPNQTPELGLFGRRPESLLSRTPFNPGNRGATATRRLRWC